jgi:type II secretory pathway pseudopilin PulG
LIEAMVSLTLLSMIGAVLLSASQTAVLTASQSMDEMIAQGIAQQVMDEAIGLPYVTKSYTSSNPNAVEISDMGNAANSGSRYGGNWGDVDDYNGATPTSTYAAQPPTDMWGATFGLGNSTVSGSTAVLRNSPFRIRSNFFDTWRLETNCYYLSPNDLSQRLTTGYSKYRALEVRVYRILADNSKLLLATVRRVHCHVPKPTT